MYEFPKVGPEQERFSLFAGEWDSQVRFYFDPTQPPMEKAGRYTAKLNLGGYFLDREFEVDLDDAGDFAQLAFHGRGLTGYDPFAGKYLGVWADSGSPALYQTEGAFDASGRVFKEVSVGPGPDGKELHLRLITEIAGSDRQLFSIRRLLETGEEVLITEMVHTRKR
ncbi:DUF1579 family protein [Allomesorhizobium alhagi]|uniref:DUF1579 domain-containing protein n=1 Tax=Mesorhizobium alhagi CCNWXJ12-2 TaxID=1107882 RepID=H0HY02_9HYPH|nr:DUF1579 family protein [Mesorhizobium alhagi]EHK54368.1 hypothetical protein MAXJ12_25403 [Mesorhizobium alhagi CCNWXJ12-2]